MACAASAAGKDGSTGPNSALVAATTVGNSAGQASNSSSVAGAVGGGASGGGSVVGSGGSSGGQASSQAVSVPSRGAAQTAAGGGGVGNVVNRQSRFAMEGVGARVIRGPDWKWGKQVSVEKSSMLSSSSN